MKRIITSLMLWLFLMVPAAAQDEPLPAILAISAQQGVPGQTIMLSANQPQLVCNLWDSGVERTTVYPLGVTDSGGVLTFAVPEIAPGAYAIYCAMTDPPGGGVTVALTQPLRFDVVVDTPESTESTPTPSALCAVPPYTDPASLLVDSGGAQTIHYAELGGLPQAGTGEHVAILLVDFFAGQSLEQVNNFSHGDLVTRQIFGLKAANGGESIRLITIDLSESESGSAVSMTQLIGRIGRQLESALDKGYTHFVAVLNFAISPCAEMPEDYQGELIIFAGGLQALAQNYNLNYVAPAGDDSGSVDQVPAALPGVISVAAADYPNAVQASYANPSKDGIVEPGGVFTGLLDGYGLRGSSFAAPVHAVRLALAATAGEMPTADSAEDTSQDSHPQETHLQQARLQQARPQQADQFVIAYYEHINRRDYALTWTWLSERFKQRRSADYETDYVGWWDRVAEVEIGQVVTISEGDTQAVVMAVLTYHMKNGSTVSHPTPYFYLVRDGDSWLIDNTSRR